MATGGVLMDVAGGHVGGAARWRAELDAYLVARSRPIRVIGRGRFLTGGWLLSRERLASGAAVVFASNNVSFGMAGRQRRVLVHNALHFLYPHEEHLLGRMPMGWRAQVPIVRQMLRRADRVVVPCSAMADRISFHLPSLRDRIETHTHPISPIGPRQQTLDRFILVPVVPGPYKNLFPQLRLLANVLDRLGHEARIRLTAPVSQLPVDLAARARIQPIGIVSHDHLACMWRTAWAAFFPSTLEAFGYPLAEARVYGVPVIAPISDQASELAGPALRAYDSRRPETLVDAIGRIDDPLEPDEDAFNRDRYFDCLLDRSR